MLEGISYKKTKGNPSIYGGKFGTIYFHVYRNTNMKNTKYFVLSFARFMGNGRWANFNVRMDEMGSMQLAIDSATRWLRKNG